MQGSSTGFLRAMWKGEINGSQPQKGHVGVFLWGGSWGWGHPPVAPERGRKRSPPQSVAWGQGASGLSRGEGVGKLYPSLLEVWGVGVKNHTTGNKPHNLNVFWKGRQLPFEPFWLGSRG